MYTSERFDNKLARFARMLQSYKVNRGIVFGGIILGALVAFELFNYSTTDFALADLLGDVRFAGVRWASILAIAFCGMDFAGLARLFTPERGRDERLEVWYLLGAWFLAATMNAMLTWWGVSLTMISHGSLGNEILSRDELITVVPVFVSVLVWLIRILMIGTFSMAGDHLFARAEVAVNRAPGARPANRPMAQARYVSADDDEYYSRRDNRRPTGTPVRPSVPASAMVRPAPKPAFSATAQPGYRQSAAYPNEPTGRPGLGRS